MDAEDDVAAFADSGCWSSGEQYEAGLHGIDNFDWGLPGQVGQVAGEEQTGPTVATVESTKEDEHHGQPLSKVPCAIVDSEATTQLDEPSGSDGESMDWESVVPKIRQSTVPEFDESSTLTMLSDKGIFLEQEGGEQLAVVSSSPYQDAQLTESTMDPVEALPLLGIASLNSSDSFSQPSALSNATKSEALDRSATTDCGTTTPITTNKYQVGERELKGLDKISPRGKTRRQTKDVVQARPSGAAKRRHQKKK
ncbi:hypothetical protein LTR01_001527 [Friedmanniomyces endolithicus]|nr:hypothetical protein LTR01_001527 [Friedmanniomyces endolithicus]KAK0830949.1 hypothetical protein LTR73_003336 [Friedmanniomyces endolithicus]